MVYVEAPPAKPSGKEFSSPPALPAPPARAEAPEPAPAPQPPVSIGVTAARLA